MNLGFSEKSPTGEPTYFAEKIWAAIELHNLITDGEAIEFSNKAGFFELDYEKIKELAPKVHTIRTDKKNRWKKGNKIHTIYSNMTKESVQFAPIFYCISTQKIRIVYEKSEFPTIHIENKELNFFKTADFEIICNLAINDGFNNVKSFLEWFDTDFKGKIIHFTDLKY